MARLINCPPRVGSGPTCSSPMSLSHLLGSNSTQPNPTRPSPAFASQKPPRSLLTPTSTPPPLPSPSLLIPHIGSDDKKNPPPSNAGDSEQLLPHPFSPHSPSPTGGQTSLGSPYIIQNKTTTLSLPPSPFVYFACMTLSLGSVGLGS